MPMQELTVNTANTMKVQATWPPKEEAADGGGHRRSIELEEKAKVVASVWWTEFIQFLAALAIFCLG